MLLLVLLTATAAALAFATSLLVGAGLAVLPRRLVRLAPATEARLLLVAALLPTLVTAVVMTGAMAPSFGWIADHCLTAGVEHGHPHICRHHVAALPGLPLVAIALLLAGRVASAAVLALVAGARVHRARRDLDQACAGAVSREFRVLPVDEPQAFLLGVLRPRLYLTRGLLAEERARDAEVVIAHERSHLRRRDPFRRLIARIGLAFHLPGIARTLECRLARAHEMAADADAARTVGSPERVARALVEMARARFRPPAPSLAFGARSTADMEARVRRLLEDQPARDLLRAPALATAVLLAQAGVLFAADAVHHGVEHALGLIGG